MNSLTAQFANRHNMVSAIFLSPFKPITTTALSKRCYSWLEELSQQFDRLYCITYSEEDFTDLLQLYPRLEVIRIHLRQEKRGLEAFLQNLSLDDKQTVKKIVAFRQTMHRAAKILTQAFPQKLFVLDLDDWDSLTALNIFYGRIRMKKKIDWMGLPKEFAIIGRSLLREIYFFPRFYSKIYLSSAEDAAKLNWFAQNKFFVRPNLLSLKTPTKLPFSKTPEQGLFFVGSFEYIPNEDAVVWLIEKILPLLRTIPDLPAWHLILAGKGSLPIALEQKIRGLPYVELHLEAPDLVPLYQRSSIVLVPVRLGGGTKLKTLEAFSYHRAVVSTRHGVRGIGATKDIHYKEAHSTKEFALAIADLLLHTEKQTRLADQAFALIEQKLAEVVP